MKTILLADDEPSLRTLVRTTLDEPGYRILEASNGTDALAMALRESVDLLVLDWMMPGLTGVEVASALKQDREKQHIPVIMLTARGQRGDQLAIAAAGIEEYLLKPFSPLELLTRVERALEVR